jgi:hypothetical protein
VNGPPRWVDSGDDPLMRELLSAALEEVAPSEVRERAHEVVSAVLAQGAFEVNTTSGVFDTGTPGGAAAVSHSAGTGGFSARSFDASGFNRSSDTSFDGRSGDASNLAVEPMVRDTLPLEPLLPMPGVPANEASRTAARENRLTLEQLSHGLGRFANACAAARLTGAAQLAAAAAVGIAAAHFAHFARTSVLGACHVGQAVAPAEVGWAAEREPGSRFGMASLGARVASSSLRPVAPVVNGTSSVPVASAVAPDHASMRTQPEAHRFGFVWTSAPMPGSRSWPDDGTSSPRAAASPTTHAELQPELDDWLGQQLSLLSRAERSLRAGNKAATLRALDEYGRLYPHGLIDPQVAQLRARVR